MSSSAMLRQARTAVGLTQRELARRACTSQSAIAAVETGRKQVTVETLGRWLAAAGSGLVVEHPEQIRLRRRGEELAQVLQLAQALPFRRRSELSYPRVPG